MQRFVRGISEMSQGMGAGSYRVLTRGLEAQRALGAVVLGVRLLVIAQNAVGCELELSAVGLRVDDALPPGEVRVQAHGIEGLYVVGRLVGAHRDDVLVHDVVQALSAEPADLPLDFMNRVLRGQIELHRVVLTRDHVGKRECKDPCAAVAKRCRRFRPDDTASHQCTTRRPAVPAAEIAPHDVSPLPSPWTASALDGSPGSDQVASVR